MAKRYIKTKVEGLQYGDRNTLRLAVPMMRTANGVNGYFAAGDNGNSNETDRSNYACMSFGTKGNPGDRDDHPFRFNCEHYNDETGLVYCTTTVAALNPEDGSNAIS